MTTPLERWVDEQARLFEPKEVYWCDGSEGEARRLIDKGIREEKIGGQPIFRELNHRNWPKSYLHRSHPTDVARTEQLTFVCHPGKGPGRPEQQLDGPGQGQGAHDRAFARGHARPDDVRPPLHDGPSRLPVRQSPASRSPTSPTWWSACAS